MNSFKYDPFGRRIEKSSSATTSVFAYDGDNLIEETNTSGALVARYEQALKIDEPLAMLRSSATSYYQADGLGSITSLTNSSGAAAETYTYDSFGKQTASAGSLINPFQYTGRELDSETGLHYYRARYYDPTVGRFLGEDLLRFGIGPTIRGRRSKSGPTFTQLMSRDALNGRSSDFYSYAVNSPIDKADPSGLWQFTVGGGDGLGGLITFGHNDGQWNIGAYAGVAVGGFFSYDPGTVECKCGFNAKAQGDVKAFKGVGTSMNLNQNGRVSGSIDVTDPSTGLTWSMDPFDPTAPPDPSLGVGAGAFVGLGYTKCF